MRSINFLLNSCLMDGDWRSTGCIALVRENITSQTALFNRQWRTLFDPIDTPRVVSLDYVGKIYSTDVPNVV